MGRQRHILGCWPATHEFSVNVDELFRNRNRLFWILNISGWVGYVLAAWLGALAHEKPESYFVLIAATALVGFFVTIPMRYLYRKLWSGSVLALGAGMLVTSYVVSLGWWGFTTSGTGTGSRAAGARKNS